MNPSDARRKDVGYDTSLPHAGSFLLEDDRVIEAHPAHQALEVLPLAEALATYPWLDAMRFTLVSKEDSYVAETAAGEPRGVFIRIRAGEQLVLPVQSCFFLKTRGFRQHVHNIIIAEKGSELHLVNGCTTANYVDAGLHIGVTEYHIGEGARVSSTMIHHWGEKVEVYPRSGVTVARGGHFTSNYIAMTPVGRIETYPTAWVEAEASAIFNAIVYAHPHSVLDLGSRIHLLGENAHGEIISRTVSNGGAVINRGHLVGHVKGAKGHMECSGLLLHPQGVIHAVPELEGKAPDLSLSHEASVGMIGAEELSYLMAAGLDEERARNLIIQGFLDIPLGDLPEQLKQSVAALIAQARSGEAV